MQSRQSGPHQAQYSRQQGNPAHLARLQDISANQLNGQQENTASVIPKQLHPPAQLMNRKQDNSSHQLAGQLDSSVSHRLQQLNPVSQVARKQDCATAGAAKFADEFEDIGCNEDMMERELMATLDEGLDIKDCQTQIEHASSAKVKGLMARQSNQGEGQGHQQRSKSTEEAGEDGFQENDLEILQRMQLLDHERKSLAQQIESEEKNRKWYYDQIEMITRKIRSLPAIDGHPNQQPGLTRKHLEFEISKLRQTMLESFGTNEQIQQRRDAQMQNIHQIEAEMIVLQQHHEQLMQQKQAKLLEGQGFGRFPSSSDTIHSSGSDDHDAEQVTMAVSMATQTEEQHHEQHPIPGAIYHGTWPIDENAQGSSAGMLQNGDVASVMSFNSTNTSSSRGSLSGGHVWTMHQQPQTTLQATGSMHSMAPQQLGKKQDMLYGLMSMLGAQDKDDTSRTLLAMSSSRDSCIAMRQSGCLPLLVQLLHGSDKDSSLLGNTRGSKAARIRAASALHNIVHSHPDDKRGRKEARVLRLLEQIRAHCDQLKETSSDEEDDGKSSVSPNIPMDPHPGSAIATLMKLSFDEEHRHAICTLGGLHAIAELLQVDSDVNRDTDDQYSITMRRYACMALTNLTFGDGTNKALLCSMKSSMEALVAQLLSANEELCQVAASVLRNLSWKADLASKKTLREVGAVTLLMQASMRVEKESTLKSILSALWNLSAHCSENKADICAVEQALEFLISTLQYKSPSKTTAIIENGGGILRNVSSHIAVREDYRQILRQYGCLQILLKHLRSPSLTIVSNACGTLWNLSARCAEDQQALWEMGAAGMLRNLVNSKHKMISMGSSAALKNLLAARPAMKNMELNKQTNANRPSLHARKQRALESEIDQNLSETCENVESPRDSPVESKKASGHFAYPVYPVPDDCHRSVLRNQVLPRSQSGDNALCAAECQKNPQGVARSGSQDSVGSTHSDISHDRSHHASGGKGPMVQVNMGGSLDRNKETLTNHCGQGQRIQFDGRTERNPLGVPNSRILQVMQEVAVHAGIDGQSHDSVSSIFKAPFPVSGHRSLSHPAPQQQSQNSSFPTHLYGMPQQTLPYHMYKLTNIPQAGTASHLNITSHPSYPSQRNQDDDDEKPLDYSMKYREGTSVCDSVLSQSLPKQPMVGNFGIKKQTNHNVSANLNNAPVNNPCYSSQPVTNNMFGCHSAYAETDLDDPDQTTDYSARYGVDYNTEQYKDSGISYGASYNGSDPNCADCKLEEARRYNDRLEQTICDDQIKTFCTEDTPYLSTATSLTDLSTAVKILEEAEEHCPADAEDDVPQNFSSKYGESDQEEIGHERGKRSSLRLNEISQGQQQLDGDKSSRSGSQMTDIQTGTTVIANYHLKTDRRSQETNSNENYEPEERSFHDNRNDDAPMDHTKIYCEEGTPVCFSRVSSLSSLHSSEAADKQDKRPQGPLKKIEEKEDGLNNSTMKMQPPTLTPNSFRQKREQQREMNYHHNEKEQKTVTFDDKEQVQETPMMFSRSTSLGSLSSFDTQSVHSSVFSEYSRRASEVVSPSELPDSPSETMPPSPRRAKSPDQINRKMELYPRNVVLQKFTTNITGNIQGVNPLTRYNVDKPVDYDTGSCKSEAPVMYADEGTPPNFSDNLSELSCITGNNYGINNKTLVDDESKNNQNFVSHRHLYEGGIKRPSTNNDVIHSSGSKEALQGTAGQSTKITNETLDNSDNKLNMNIRKDVDNQCKGINNKNAEIAVKGDENGISSNSDVSEGEDDILANIISSAMPISSKRIKKSSSDNAVKRKSCQQDNGSSSKLKTSAKSQSESSSKSSSVSNSAKKSVNLDPADAGLPDGTDVKSSPKSRQIVPGHGKDGNSPVGKQRSQIPRPLQHRQLQQLQNGTSLNISLDSGSASSYTDDDSPFNISNTQSVIARSVQSHQVTRVISSPVATLSSIKPSPLILQKAKNLSNADVAPDEGLKTYATEDTPFSGSVPGSPGNTQKHFSNMPLIIDTNQDTIQSFATEDTPFSGSAPQSPSVNNARLYDSPQMNRNTKNSQSQFTQNTTQVGIRKSEISQNKTVPIQNGPQFQNHCLNRMERSASTNTVQTKMPAANPSVSAQLLSNFGYISNDYDAGEDTLKTFATEGTPLNYSRTGSCSDLSSLNANFEEKVRIDVKSNSSSQKNPAEDCGSDDSSLIDENEDLLSQIIQSAMPAAKTTKSRHSVDRQAEGAERKNNSTTQRRNLNKQSGLGIQKPMSVISSNFQPQRTSSLVQDRNIVHSTQINNDGYDQVKTYAVEDTPNNLSEATSLSDLSLSHNGSNTQFKTKRNMSTSNTDQSSVKCLNHTSAYTVSNDSVFLDSDFETGNSLKVYQVEGTPQSFSCNESLSSLGIVDDESNNDVLQQVKLIVQQLTKSESKLQQNIASGKVARSSSVEHGMASTDTKIERPHSRSSVNSTKSVFSGKEMERHVIGQSNEDQSLHEHEDIKKQTTDEVRNYEVEDTPICFSRCSSLSSVHDIDNDVNRKPNETKSNRKPAVDTDNKLASKDESAAYKVEHTPICFSRNSSLTSLSVHSDDDDDPNDMALLEDCISSALPPRTRPCRIERHRSSLSSRTEPAGTINSRSGNDKHISINKSLKNNACLGDELEQPGSHDSRISKWKQPPKSKEEIFRTPTMDAKGQPCRRSRSQDSEKHLKDLSNQQIINLNAHRGSFDSLTYPPGIALSTADDIEKHQQEIISVSQNLTRSIEHHVRKLNRSTDKLGDNESEKSPFEEYNFFMTCSGATEISVESISRQSFPSSMAPDHLMDGTFIGSQRIDADGEIGNSSCETTLTDRNIPRSLNGSLTVSKGKRSVMGMEGSLTSEDERALAENANIVMSEMMVNRMLVSGASVVDEENFIENETLALVANEYVSDTASEGSVTWSAVSDMASECSSNKTEVNSQMGRRARILKPGAKDQIHYERETEVKAIRGKRKPLYSSKSVSSASQSTKLPDKNRADNVTGVARNISPRTVPGAPSPSNASGSRKTHNLRTIPQASSTPVKSNSPSKPCSNKSSPIQKTSSFEQKIQNVKTVSATRSGGVSSINNTPTRISSRSSPRGNVSAKESTDRPKHLMKQATFIKEPTNKNAPVVSSIENKQNIPGVKMRQSKLSESSLSNRNSSGSSKSNLSNTSHNSLSTSSSDSPPDSWSKTLNTYNFVNEQLATDAKTSMKESTTQGSFGAGQTSANKHRMNSCPATRIPSPACATLNKTSSGSNLKNVGIDSKVIKSSSGTSLGHINRSDLMKTGSVNSLKQNSRPTTPVNLIIRKGSSGAMVKTKQDDSLKQTEKKTVTSKFAGLWKSEKAEEKSKMKSEMQISSKLPVARNKMKNETVKEQEVKKREPSPKQSANRNTYILNESIADRVSKSSTYDKLNVTTDKTQIPNPGQDEHDVMIKSGTSNSSGSSNSSKTKSVFEQNSELNKTCRDISAIEIGVEYNLDDAWACNIEKSIEVMLRSIEDNKNRIDSFYDDTVDTSKMDLTGSPAKRLSKSGSMSEIELEFGRIHSGTWTKKKSHNDFNTLPNAEETNRVIPLVKRSESLNFQTQMTVSHFYENDDSDVWIRRDDKMRSSDVPASRKKKKSFGGSSSFLNAVSKMFGVSKKSGDKLGKSSSAVYEKHIKTKNESNAKVKKNKDDKSNKSETQASKAEAKLLRAEQKAEARQLKMQAKMNKSEIKASKKEAKLSKRRKSESSQYVDNTSQYLSSSTSSLKRSAADLIDIDKSDNDDDGCNQNEKFAIPLSVSQTFNDRKNGFHNGLTDSDSDQKGNTPVPKSPGRQKTLALKSDSIHKSPHFSKHNASTIQYNADHSASLSVSIIDTSLENMSVKQRPEQGNASINLSNTLNKSVKLSNSPSLTKTEMLLARRHMQLSTAESGDSDEEVKRKFIITTV